MKMKYLILDDGYETPILFPEYKKHDDMSRKLGKAISAGFVSFGPRPEGEVGATCYGESVSLKIKSRPEDSGLISRLLKE